MCMMHCRMSQDYYPTGYHTLKNFFYKEQERLDFERKLQYIKEREEEDEELKSVIEEMMLEEEIKSFGEFMRVIDGLYSRDKVCWKLVKCLERLFDIKMEYAEKQEFRLKEPKRLIA